MTDTLNTIINHGVEIGSALQGSTTLIKGVDNSIVGSLLYIIAGLIIRSIEKRRLRKQGKLTDK